MFTVDAFPGEKFEARVYLISPQIQTGTRALDFGALIANPQRRLKASSYARGELVLERNVPTIVVPLDAVMSFAGLTRVFLFDNGIARGRTVKVGRVLGNKQAILSGVRPGDSVIVSGLTKLYDGAKVRLRNTTEALAGEPSPKDGGVK